MIHHLEVSTLTALVSVAAALLLRRASAASSAALRHLILLVGILRFAVYTPWLEQAGAWLDRFVPAHHAAAPHVFHVTLRLLLPNPNAPVTPHGPVPFDWSYLKQVAWWLWCAGAGFGLGALLGRLLRPVRAIREAGFWERDMFLQVTARARMSRRANLWIVSQEEAPGAQGWVRPRVLVPDGLMPGTSERALSEEETETVLTHELAHLKRRDPLIAGVVRAIASVFWFHPLVWWMERRMLEERETACDEMVLESGVRPEDYASGIAKICQGALGGEVAYASFTGANLARRIEHILSGKKPRMMPRAAGLIPVALAVMAALIPVAGGLLRAQTAKGEADSLYQAAEALRRTGNITGALALFEQAEAAGNRPATLAVALLLDSTGHPAQALPRYQKIISEDPANFVALNNAAYLLAKDEEDLSLALIYARRAFELSPDSPEIADTLGWVYLKMNQPDQAMLAFRDPVLKQPNNFTFRSHLAEALDEKADPPEWVRELRSVIFENSRESEARLRELLEAMGK